MTRPVDTPRERAPSEIEEYIPQLHTSKVSEEKSSLSKFISKIKQAFNDLGQFFKNLFSGQLFEKNMELLYLAPEHNFG